VQIGVLVVEDEPECMRRFMDVVLADPGLALCGAVSTVAAALAVLRATAPDVALVDLGLPDRDGSELIRDAIALHPKLEVLVVTMFSDDQHVISAIEAGATGYLLKDASGERITQAIHAIHSGDAAITPSIARRVLARFRERPARAEPMPAPAESPLTERETEILQLICKGLSFAEVAGTLNVSPHTVVAHVKRIYRKLAVHSRGEAVFEARLLGLA
jgi:DNA-binding NarL/FixJ family response regulator